ncbi:MAG: metal-sensitive transcriptional regulator [Hyphomicrobiales bacterium]|nr:metal-sensitive transcriptional regulator [Hyphomicrobiales bacterium]MDE2114647.1 metal-sensitive transcriptional regulator [Hyphomicrobiales bacterium]
MQNETKTTCRTRLKRIEGQVRGIANMVEEDRYCIDIIHQIAAARAALKRVETVVLKDHVNHCVAGAINSGDQLDQRRKVDELMQVLGQIQP